MSRLARLAGRLAVLAQAPASSGVSGTAIAQVCAPLQAAAASLTKWTSPYHSSTVTWATTAPAAPAGKDLGEQEKHLLDKDMWDEAWAHDPRFGTADNPIEVPSLLPERIIGVTDPLDDTLVIWSIVREGEPPRQLVEGGEFFVLRRVERIERVADRLGVPSELAGSH